MAIITREKITSLYERYKEIDVTYTRDIIEVTGMITQQVYLKCEGDFWPCVVYSSSFQSAKVVVNIKTGFLDKLQRTNNMVSLRFCFKTADAGTVTFFVAARSTGYSLYGDSKEMGIFTIQFTQRPPDDLIEIFGKLLDANVNSTKRKDERVVLTPEIQRRLKLLSKETAVFIEKVPRRCIIRDLSFSGSKIIMVGVAKFLQGKRVALRVDFVDPQERFLISGEFVRVENVEGLADLIALAINFTETLIPMGFKIRLNDYMGQVRAVDREIQPESSMEPLRKESKAVEKKSARSRQIPAEDPLAEALDALPSQEED